MAKDWYKPFLNSSRWKKCRESYLSRFDKPIKDEIAEDGYLWIVQCGAYKSKNNAQALVDRLEKMGVISIIKKYQEIE